jgi:pyruvate dehydrogenase E2 component (dihydrolipoamide acetyltransferase)
MIKKVVMPAAGQTTDIATVTKLKVQVGDPVKKGDVLLEVETDKAVLPIESFAKGFVTAVYVNEFDTVDAGTPLLAIGDAADLEAAKSAPAEAEPAPVVVNEDDEDDFAPVMQSSSPALPAVAPAVVSAKAEGVRAMPNAKRLAAELGLDLSTVKAENGAFVKVSDVRRAAEATKPTTVSAPVQDEPETIPVARMRNTLARRWESFVPTFTVSVSCSLDAFAALEQEGARPVHYVMMALSRLALRYPILRACNDGGRLPLSEGSDVALAVYGDNGTVGAVVFRADAMGVRAIAEACEKNLIAVQKGDLSAVVPCPVTVYDATAYGVDGFVPPVSAPGVAAFGLTVTDSKLNISGSFDIRVMEGNVGASMMADLRRFIENPVLMLL